MYLHSTIFCLKRCPVPMGNLVWDRGNLETWGGRAGPLQTNPRSTKAEMTLAGLGGGGGIGAQALVSCSHTQLKITYTGSKARPPGPHLLAHSSGSQQGVLGRVRIGVSVTTGIRQGQGTYIVPCLL